MKTSPDLIANVFQRLTLCLDERSRRLVVAAEATLLGRGGVTFMHKTTGMAMSTIRRGQIELMGTAAENLPPKEEAGWSLDLQVGDEPQFFPSELPLETGLVSQGRIRRPGGGRKRLENSQPELVDALKKLFLMSLKRKDLRFVHLVLGEY